MDEKPKTSGKVVHAKSKRAPTKITPELIEELFLEYCRTRSVRAVAIKFGLAESTIHRLKKKENWEADFEKVLDRARDRTIKKAAGMAVKNIRVATGIRDKVATALLNTGTVIDPSVNDFVAISKYIDQLEGTENDRDRGETLIAIINQIDQASHSDRRQLVGNCLAGLGINDQTAGDQLAQVWPGRVPTSDRVKSGR